MNTYGSVWQGRVKDKLNWLGEPKFEQIESEILVVKLQKYTENRNLKLPRKIRSSQPYSFSVIILEGIIKLLKRLPFAQSQEFGDFGEILPLYNAKACKLEEVRVGKGRASNLKGRGEEEDSSLKSLPPLPVNAIDTGAKNEII